MKTDSNKGASEDGLLSLLPDTILPSQFFASVGTQTFSSEQRLMLAVLIDAIKVLGESRGSPSPRKLKSFREASSWVFANGLTSPLSFDHVCDALGVDAERLRRRLSALLSQNSTLLRLRLKEGGRMQRVTVNRGRRIRRRAGPGRSAASV